MSENNLYIHIPFCKKICPYCDFYKMVASNTLKQNYLKAVLEESKLKNIDFYALETLYVGGGTPSCIPVDMLDKFLSKFSNNLNLDVLKEFTFEINPEDINFELLHVLKKHHVNRLSIGIQSFNKDIQTLINRPLEYSDLCDKIKLVNDLGFNNYSFDLMYGFYKETLDDIKNDIDLLVSLKPTHISTYCLMVEDHTLFGYMDKKSGFKTCTEKEEKKQYFFIIKYLKSLGYIQYETSNFSLKGYESVHNLTYWNGEYYECLGAGASSFISCTHYKTTQSIHDYIFDLSNFKMPKREMEYLEFEDRVDEYVIMNLRKIEGINLNDFKIKFGFDLSEFYNYESLVEHKYLIKKGDFLRLSKKYLFVQNAIIVKLISRGKDSYY